MNLPLRFPIGQAALALGVPVRTVQDLAARGAIPDAAKIGKRWTFTYDGLLAFMTPEEAKLAKGTAKKSA